MKYIYLKTIIYTLMLPALMTSMSVTADDSTSKTETGKETVLTPANMSREDGLLLKEYAAEYNHCLTDTSIKQMQGESDPRHVVDYAMKTCAVKLEELDRKMIERNFDPNFRKGYIRSVSNRSANNVLRTVMMGMAAKQGQSEE